MYKVHPFLFYKNKRPALLYIFIGDLSKKMDNLNNISEEYIKNSLADTFNIKDDSKKPDYSKDTMSFVEALEKYDPCTEVVSSGCLLDHNIVIALSDDEDIIRAKGYSEAKKHDQVPYIYAYNKKDRLIGIKATREDIKNLNKLKFRVMQIGVPGTDPKGDVAPIIKDVINNLDKVHTKKTDKQLKKQLYNFQHRPELLTDKEKAELKAIYARTHEEARKFAKKQAKKASKSYSKSSKVKTNIFKRFLLWFKSIIKSQKQFPENDIFGKTLNFDYFKNKKTLPENPATKGEVLHSVESNHERLCSELGKDQLAHYMKTRNPESEIDESKPLYD